MRKLAFAACAVFLSLTGAAHAADCTKGMLWPYVRSPGDCLTDEEIRTGRIGTYSGPVNTDPDLSAIPRDAPVQSGAVAGGSAAGGSSGDNGALINTGIFSDGHPARTSKASCSKGIFWPFVRSDGDCATQAERQDGKRVYGNPAAVAATPVNASGDTAIGTKTPNTPEADPGGSAVSAPACHKGAFWPFVREPGDCPTDAEKKAQTGKN